MRLTAALSAAAADGPPRARGLIVPWGVPGRTSRGRVAIERGAVCLPEDVSRVKLTLDHDDTRPVAVLEAVEETPEGLFGTFRYGSTPLAAAAYAELVDGLRDGLSVDLVDVVLSGDRVTAAYCKAVSQVSAPAYDDSRALAAASTEDPPPVIGEPPMSETLAAAAPADPPTVAPPAAALSASATRTRPVSAVHTLADRLTAARFAGGDAEVAATLTAALADITPAGNGAGHELTGLATMAAGELMADAYTPVYGGCVSAQRLTGMEITGWHWDVVPGVADYAGNKAEIPTGPGKLKSVAVTAKRIAGGHDIDRIYADLGSRDVIVSYWRLMAESVAKQLDGKRLGAVQAAAGSASAAAGVAEAILAGVTAVKGADYALVSGDLVADMLAKPATELASLFTGNGIVSTTVPAITVAPDLTGTVIVGKRSAVKFYTIDPALRFEAVHIAKGGIDTGVFSYWAALPSPFGGVKAYTVAAAQSAARASK